MNSETLEFENRRLVEESVASAQEVQQLSDKVKELEERLAKAKFALAESHQTIRNMV